MVKKPKLLSGIRTKLFSAVAMLLVAVIMVVSSTYAWFTLSTAPEVTGISTAIGANGSLEMALLPTNADMNTITSNTGDGLLATVNKNLTWGNMVDLDDASYGLDQITLYPSALNLSADGKINVGGGMLKFPTYGPDGRVQTLAADTFTGIYNSSTAAFLVSNGYGVRGVGAASGMTPTQIAYRDARSAANTAIAQAKSAASVSLNQNGSTLANVAIKRATSPDATFTKEDVAALQAIVDDLLGVEGTKAGALQYVEEAYKQLFLAMVASKAGQDAGIPEEVVTGLKSELATKTMAELLSTENSNPYAPIVENLPEAFITGYNEYKASLQNAQNARNDINTIYTFITTVATQASITEAEVQITWGAASSYQYGNDQTVSDVAHPGMSAPLYKLADTDGMLVNGIAASEIKDKMSELVNGVASSGLTVTMQSKLVDGSKVSGGIYVDIADQCGDYSAQVKIKEVTCNGLTLSNVNAKMVTDAYMSPAYLTTFSTVIGADGNAPAAGDASASAAPLTEMYGYIIDMAFRTNAAESNLLLQTSAVDRIYQDSEDAAAATMGHGSNMSFKSTNVSKFSNEQMVELMGNIRIVFFDPMSGNVFAYAKLDTVNLPTYTKTETIETETGSETVTNTYYKTDADGYVTADIVLYAVVDNVKIDDSAKQAETGHLFAKGTENVLYWNIDGKYYDAETNGREVAMETILANVNTVVDGTIEKTLTDKDAIITALNQNQAQAVSTLVYLDGNSISNADVAADVATSMTGKMNIQFASSAALVPMNVAGLNDSASNTPSENP